MAKLKKTDEEVTFSVTIGYGVMSGKLSKQLDEQNLVYDKKKIKHLEKVVESMHYIRFADIVSDSQYEKMFQRLHKHVMKCVKGKVKEDDASKN